MRCIKPHVAGFFSHFLHSSASVTTLISKHCMERDSRRIVHAKYTPIIHNILTKNPGISFFVPSSQTFVKLLNIIFIDYTHLPTPNSCNA